MPVQRLPRYQLLLQALIGLTPKEHVDYDNLIQAHDAVVTVNLYIENRQSSEIEKDHLIKALITQRSKKKEKRGKNLNTGSRIFDGNGDCCQAPAPK